ncbi:MAG: 50S ribosomal protein L6 [Planctomycetota bacterium]
MSRIGRKPVEIPPGVEVKLAGPKVSLKGKLGALEHTVPPGIQVAQDGARLQVTRAGETKAIRALHGLTRSLLNGMVKGVTQGYERQLEIVGVSYQASATPKALTLKLGFADDVVLEIPQGLSVEVPNPTSLTVRGADKRLVGQFAADIRRLRPPEPYKGKGVRYRGEHVPRKQGKSFVGTEQ